MEDTLTECCPECGRYALRVSVRTTAEGRAYITERCGYCTAEWIDGIRTPGSGWKGRP